MCHLQSVWLQVNQQALCPWSVSTYGLEFVICVYFDLFNELEIKSGIIDESVDQLLWEHFSGNAQVRENIALWRQCHSFQV